MTTTSTEQRPSELQSPAGPAGQTSGAFLLNVQALRAAAVLLVVGFHLWPERVPGGFAGVDVFFVISGYLITGHLHREMLRTGRVSLVGFYARRIKRLFPAALLVLAVCAVGTVLFLPTTTWIRSFQEIAASALYYENWSLAVSSADYFAAENAATPAQHYWSLSVEEQFYIVWPLLFILGALVASRWPGHRRIALLLPLAAVLICSFAYSVTGGGLVTPVQYFSTFTRAWEFAAGGLLAMLWAGRRSPGGWASGLSWIGIAAVVLTGFLLNDTMRFPGWVAAIPVLGAVAVIAAGTPEQRWGPGRLISNRAVQLTGTISYALYLWHWPLIIFFGGGTRAPKLPSVVLFAASFLLALATTYLVEGPVRRIGAPSVKARSLVLAVGAGSMVLVWACSHAVEGRVSQVQSRAVADFKSIRKNPPACLGAPAYDRERPECADWKGAALVPSPLAAFEDRAKACMQTSRKAPLRTCTFGVDPDEAERSVAVIGDSHVVHWLPTVQVIAEQERWHVTALTKGSCPLTEARRSSGEEMSGPCVDWNASVHEWLSEHPETTHVITSASSRNRMVPEGGLTWYETAVAGYQAAWERLPQNVQEIAVIRDVPRPRANVVDCSQLALQNGWDVQRCGRSEADAVLPDPQVEAARSSDRNVTFVDLNQYMCRDGYCSPEVGSAFVYRDGHHMTATFARTVAPYLRSALADAGQ